MKKRDERKDGKVYLITGKISGLLGKSMGETMEKEERRPGKDRRSGSERRKARSFSYKGIERRSGRDRRVGKGR
jgi:hypothetical protein